MMLGGHVHARLTNKRTAISRLLACLTASYFVLSIRTAADNTPPKKRWLQLNQSAPTAEKTDVDLRGTVAKVHDRVFTTLNTEVRDIVWPREGGHLYILTPSNVISKVAMPSLKEVRRIQVDGTCHDIGVAYMGIVVALRSRQEVHVYDAHTLSLIKTIAIKNVTSIATSPTLNMAVATIGDEQNLVTIDLRSGQVMEHYPRGLAQGKYPEITPDGRYFFCRTWAGKPSRFTVNETALSAEAVGNSHEREMPYAISDDSRFIAMPNRNDWSIYRIDDIDTPVAKARGTQAFVFDKAGLHLYSAGDPFGRGVLYQMKADGTPIKEFQMPDDVGPPRKMLADPAGHNLLLVCGRPQSELSLVWCEPLNSGAPTAVVDVETQLIDSWTSIPGCRYTNTTLDVKKVAGPVIVSDGGKTLFVLEHDGLLRKIRLGAKPTEIRQLHIGSKCSAMAMARAGLVIRVIERQELWVVDPSTLQLVKTIPQPGTGELASSPAINAVFARVRDKVWMVGVADDVFRYEIDPLKLLAESSRKSGRFVRFSQMLVTADGKYLLVGDSGSIARFIINHDSIEWDATGPELGGVSYPPKYVPLSVSDDGRYVARLTYWSKPISEHPKIQVFGAYIYGVDELDIPRLTLDAGYHFTYVGFDPVDQKVYAAQHNGYLTTYGADGKRLNEYKLFENDEQISQLIAHQQGKRFVIVSNHGIRLIQITGEESVSLSATEPASVATTTDHVDDVFITSLDLKAKQIYRRVAWSPEGNFAYFLDTRGFIREIAVPSLVQTRQLNLGIRAKTLSASMAGLLVTNTELNELWVIAPESLTVTQKITIPNIKDAVSLPNVPYTYLKVSGNLAIVDSKTHKVIRKFSPERLRHLAASKTATIHPKAGPFNSFEYLQLTQDGRWLLANSFGSIHRMRIRGDDVALDGTGPRLKTPFVTLSPSGKLLAASAPTSTSWKTRHELHLYKTTNLQSPFRTVPTNHHCIAAFSPHTNALYYLHNSMRTLQIEPLNGAPSQAYDVGQRLGNADRLVFHPSGGASFLFADTKLHWLEFGKRGTRQPPEAPSRTVSAPHHVPAPANGHWLGRHPSAVATGAQEEGKTTTVGQKRLFKRAFRENNVKISVVEIDATELLPAMQWTRDGQSVLVISRLGIIHKIRMTDGVRTARFELGQRCQDASMSSKGLVVAMTDVPQVWVIDDNTMTVSHKMAVPDIHVVASAAKLPVAYGFSRRLRLAVMDLRSGRIASNRSFRDIWDAQDFIQPADTVGAAYLLAHIDDATVTRDGKHLFCVSSGRLHRFRVSGLAVQYKEISPDIRCTRVVTSRDSTLVATTPNKVPSALPKYRKFKRQNGIYIYNVSSFFRPRFALDGFSWNLGIDTKAKRFYTSQSSKPLIISNAKGTHLAELKLVDPETSSRRSPSRIHQFLIAPGGQRMLALSNDGLFWIDTRTMK